MRKIAVGAIVALTLGVSGSAYAVDLAARPSTPRPPPMVAAVYDWTGFYVGINGGGGSSHKCWDFISPGRGILVPEGCHDATGATVGGQIGYRWQAANWVFGVEGQGNWADFSGDNISILFAGDRNRSRIEAFGLLTGQIGYAFGTTCCST